MILVSVKWRIALFLLLAPATASAELLFGRPPRDPFAPFAEVNLGYLGHFGSAGLLYGPAGGFTTELTYGYWYKRMIGLSVSFLHSIPQAPTFWGLGLGGRINLLELSQLPGNVGGGGLLAFGLRTLVLRADGGLNELLFQDTDQPIAESPSGLWPYFGGGVEWVFNFAPFNVDTLFLNTSLHFLHVAGAFYSLPEVGLGVRF